MRQLVDQAWCPLFRLGLQNLICHFLNGSTAWVMGSAKPAFRKGSASEQQNPPRNRLGNKVIIQLCNRATDSTHRWSDSIAASPRTDRLFRRRPAFRSVSRPPVHQAIGMARQTQFFENGRHGSCVRLPVWVNHFPVSGSALPTASSSCLWSKIRTNLRVYWVVLQF